MGKNNYNGNNNYNNGGQQNANPVVQSNGQGNSKDDAVVKGLLKVNCPLRLKSASFVGSTADLADAIVELVDAEFGIRECDHAYIYPERDKHGNIINFSLGLYFNTDKTRGTNNWNVRRIGGGRKNHNDAFEQAICQRTNTSEFEFSELALATLGNIAILDAHGNIVSKRSRDFPQVVIVECDFLRVCELLLDIEHNDRYDFYVSACEPIGGKNNASYYNIEITKEIISNKGKRGKSGINYSHADARRR